MIGIPKAKVFPVPVFARAMMSRPCSAGTSTALLRHRYQKHITSIESPTYVPKLCIVQITEQSCLLKQVSDYIAKEPFLKKNWK